MEDNVVYVGSKPPMIYVMAIISSLKYSEAVIVRARGRAILTAVDAAEITRNRFLQGFTCEASIGTEQLEGEDGSPRNVSTIEINLRKSPEALNPGGVS